MSHKMNASGDQLPKVSVIIAVYNGGEDLDRCLAAISVMDYPDFECILVDDVSSDGQAQAAAGRYDISLLTMGQRSGPARARNRGAREAAGEILFFTDADVVLHPDALSVAVGVLQSDAELGAVFGSYDDQPGHPSFLSQYRNLLHHWVHQNSDVNAWTFWAGCGAIRRDVFEQLGGFSETFAVPSIEDIELGSRVRRAGYGIRLQKDLLGSHLKHWKLWNLLKTDVFRRAVPWMRLLLQDQYAPADMNVDIASRLATAAAGLLLLSLIVLPLLGHGAAALPALVFLLLASTAALFGRPALAKAGGTVLALVIAVVPAVAVFAWNPDPWALLPLSLIGVLAWSRLALLRYLARIRNGAFALAVLPMQFLFFLGCGLAVPLGLIAHLRDARRTPDSTSQS